MRLEGGFTDLKNIDNILVFGEIYIKVQNMTWQMIIDVDWYMVNVEVIIISILGKMSNINFG